MQLGEYKIKRPYVKDGIVYGAVYKTKQKAQRIYKRIKKYYVSK